MKQYLSIYLTLLSAIISCQNKVDKGDYASIRSVPKQRALVLEKKANSPARYEPKNNPSVYEFKNDSIQIKIIFYKIDSINIKFHIEIQKRNSSVQKVDGLAYLIRLENNDGTFYIPEGTRIVDENTNTEYSCDSTYSYKSSEISIGFGLDKMNGGKLSFTIDNSDFKQIENHDYTLYRIL